MSDEDIALAIQLSLQEEDRRKNNETKNGHHSFPTIHENRHCNKSIYSLDPPTTCPLCNSKDISTLSTHESGIGKSKPRSICIRPTLGTFAKYNNKMLLHCGLSSSTGQTVFNFDERGCVADTSGWEYCLSIAVQTDLTDSEWDNALKTHNEAEICFNTLAGRKYHQLQNNCYDYIIRFLNSIKFGQSENHSKDKIVFQFILTPMQIFEAYYNIVTQLHTHPVVITDIVNPAQTHRHTCDGCSNLIELNTPRYRCTICEDFDLCENVKKLIKILEIINTNI
eukprot:TRINITY_DN8653_c0_g1_i1.p1 TRINITY_DN8653_c0_g1~~TRINITY_DN8653_c0_g1_i1.p1  ORF type:complete len:281 (-),score=41.18 TRINITY_DN8653_c0_g1_i1:178-1020(-)